MIKKKIEDYDRNSIIFRTNHLCLSTEQTRRSNYFALYLYFNTKSRFGTVATVTIIFQNFFSFWRKFGYISPVYHLLSVLFCGLKTQRCSLFDKSLSSRRLNAAILPGLGNLFGFQRRITMLASR